MKKKLELFANSFKLSVCAKPTAIIMFVVIILLSTLLMSIPLRLFLSFPDQVLADDNIHIECIDENNQYDYNEYKTIGDAIKQFYNDGLFQTDANLSIFLNGNNISFIKKNEKFIEAAITIELVINGFGFEREDIDSGVQKMLLSEYLMSEYGFKENEEIIFCGSKFTVHISDQLPEYDSTIYVPYTAELKNFTYFIRDYSSHIDNKIPLFKQGNLILFNSIRNLNSREKNVLKSFGFKRDLRLGEMFSGTLPFFLYFIPSLILIVLNTLFVNAYIQKLNSRKYAIYKILGTTPKLQAGIMFGEITTLTLIGIGIGILTEYIIQLFKFSEVFVLLKLNWLNYLLIFTIIMATTLITIGIKIVSHAKAKPIDEKFMA